MNALKAARILGEGFDKWRKDSNDGGRKIKSGCVVATTTHAHFENASDVGHVAWLKFCISHIRLKFLWLKWGIRSVASWFSTSRCPDTPARVRARAASDFIHKGLTG